MGAADDDRAGAVGSRHASRRVERAQRQPGTGQATPIPGLRGRARVDDERLAGLRHRVLFDLGKVRGEERKSVRRVSQEIAGDEHVADVTGHLAVEAGAFEQRSRECDERFNGVAWFRHGV
jgi:hypothetical protein